MDDGDFDAARCRELGGLRKRRAHIDVVDVSMHAHHLSVGPELLEHGNRDQVPGVNDQIGRSQPGNAAIGQPPATARQVRIGDDRDLHGNLLPVPALPEPPRP